MIEFGAKNLNFSIKLHDPISDRITDTKLSYHRTNLEIDTELETKFYCEALFYDSLKSKKNGIETFRNLDDIYTNLEEKSPDFQIKQNVKKLSEFVARFEGEWICEFAGTSLKLSGKKLFGSVLLQLSDRVKISEEFYDSATITNLRFLRYSDLKKEIMDYAKFKYPYQTLSYNLRQKSVILTRGYDYIYKKDGNYFYQNEGATYLLQDFLESELIFKGVSFETNKDGRIVGRNLYIKWRLSESYDEIEEYIKLEDSDWRESARYKRLKSE